MGLDNKNLPNIDEYPMVWWLADENKENAVTFDFWNKFLIAFLLIPWINTTKILSYKNGAPR